MGALEELSMAIGSAGESVGPSVVGIGSRWGAGSGVVIAPGRILTNAHNLRGEEIRVTLADGTTTSGRPLGVDVDGDVAVVEAETGDAKAVEWAGEARIQVGAPVFALANPAGRGLRVTVGFVSGIERSFRGPRGRRISGSIEHTAPLLPGSSGGPVVDSKGQLLGVNTNRLGEGLYLAIPADAALKERLDALGRGESPSRPRLGVAIAPPRVANHLRRSVGLAEADGLLVRQVEDDSPAAKAGIREGDLIISAGDRDVTSVDALHEAMEAAAGGSFELKLLRGAEETSVSVSLSGGSE